MKVIGSYSRLMPRIALLLVVLLISTFLAACAGPQAASSTEVEVSEQSPKLTLPENDPAPQVAEVEVAAEQIQPTAMDSTSVQENQAASVATPVDTSASPASLEPAAPTTVDQATSGETPAAVDQPQELVPTTSAVQNLEMKPEVGYQAPDFALQTLDGQVLKLSELRGRPVIISYWATWCVPCKQELPILQKLSQEYPASSLQILTINAIEQDIVENVQGLVAQMGLTMPVLLDQQNQFQSAYKQLFFPTSYYIDQNGVIRFIKLGDASEAEIRDHTLKLINNQL